MASCNLAVLISFTVQHPIENTETHSHQMKMKLNHISEYCFNDYEILEFWFGMVNAIDKLS